jgi:NAD(P)H-hydrate epimerase
MDANSVREKRIDVVQEFCKDFRGTLLLKGAFTIVAKREDAYICPVANPYMATAGSGDVLAGILAAFLAQGKDTLSATLLAVYLHALAGCIASGKGAPISASKIAENIADAIILLKEGRVHERGVWFSPYDHRYAQ